MGSLSILAAGVVLIALLLAHLCLGTEFIATIVALAGNPILRRLGLQGSPDDTEFEGRVATVMGQEGGGFKVQFDGAIWEARMVDSSWTPAVGEAVTIVRRDSLTLWISKRET